MLALTNASPIYIEQFFLHLSSPFIYVFTSVGDWEEDHKSVFVKYSISYKTDPYEADGFQRCVKVAISEPSLDCL